jgi:hypothetical protein
MATTCITGILVPWTMDERIMSLSSAYRHIDWLIMMGWDYVSELLPPMGLLFIPWWYVNMEIMVMMMPAGDNSWLVHQSSLAVLPGETSGASRRNGRRSENFAYRQWSSGKHTNQYTTETTYRPIAPTKCSRWGLFYVLFPVSWAVDSKQFWTCCHRLLDRWTFRQRLHESCYN